MFEVIGCHEWERKAIRDRAQKDRWDLIINSMWLGRQTGDSENQWRKKPEFGGMFKNNPVVGENNLVHNSTPMLKKVNRREDLGLDHEERA